MTAIAAAFSGPGKPYSGHRNQVECNCNARYCSSTELLMTRGDMACCLCNWVVFPVSTNGMFFGGAPRPACFKIHRMLSIALAAELLLR
jgi:hypothetical protein